jgi:hypothetical protein
MHVGETETWTKTCACGSTTLTVTHTVVEVPKPHAIAEGWVAEDGTAVDGPPKPVWCRGCDQILGWPGEGEA